MVLRDQVVSSPIGLSAIIIYCQAASDLIQSLFKRTGTLFFSEETAIAVQAADPLT